MPNFLHYAGAAACAFALMIPTPARADLSGAPAVSANSTISLDTGAISTSGGDLLFDGAKLTPQGNAKAYNGGNLSAEFSEINQAALQAFASLLSSASITPAVNDVIAVLTNGGNYSKVLVTAISTSSITLQFDTYGASGTTPSAPSITALQNNYSYLLPGLPNYGIAPGSLFIIKGSDLANPGTAVLQSSGGSGIPATLNGASISVTVNGVTTHPGMYYAIPTQIAAVLPSSTPVGAGTITVTYNSTPSATFPIQVVSTALGLDTYYGTGTGLGVATDPVSGAIYNYANSAIPGKSIVLWGSGLGADTADSDTVFTTTPHPVNVPLKIYIGGVQAAILYQGSSGYPGVNQINVTIPPSVQPGCGASVIAVSGTVVSNSVSLPLNPSGGPCTDPGLGITSQISSLVGASYKFGFVDIGQSTSSGQTQNTAGADFNQVTGGLSNGSGGGLTSIGSCSANQTVTGGSTGTNSTGLDAGTISVTGSAGTQSLTEFQTGSYGAQLPSGFIPSGGGTFTFNGAGGKDVGAFTATVNYTNPLTWTNMNSITSVNRAQGVNVTWSGGATNSYVLISGSSTSAGGVSASFVCYAPVSAEQFTVPSYVLLGLPAGTGSLAVENATTSVPFAATGLNYAYGIAAIFSSISPAYQ